MNDELPELTPDETERVRRLLAEARHTDPVPDDVAARLDRTLATLADERHSHKVVALASRRRRRATGFLVAAAAVVVVGIGVGQVVSGMGSGMDAGSTADDSSVAQSDADAPAEAQGEAAPEPSSKASDQAGAESSPPKSLYKSPLPRVDDVTFDADAAAARALQTNLSAYDRSLDRTCDRDAWGEGERVLVRYQGSRAALVFRPAADGSQVVDLFACDADDVLRNGIVPAP